MDSTVFHSFTFQALVAVLVLCFLTKWLMFCKPARTKHLPPSPPKFPLLGNLHQLSGLPHRDLRCLAQKHGPLMLLHLGRKPVLVISSADAAREVMKTHDPAFADRPDLKVMKTLFYNYRDVFVSPYGEYWRRLKGICVHQLLSNKRVQSFHSIMQDETCLLVKKIRESKGSMNLSKMFAEVTMDVISRAAFGIKCSEVEEGDKFLSLLKEFAELIGTISIGDFIPWLSWISHVNGFDARVDRVAKEMDAFLEGMIQARIGQTPEEKYNDDCEKNRGNFINILLDIYHESTDISIDRDSVKALVLDVFIAGTDSSSTVLEWSMSELLRHPNVMRRLKDEVREVMKDKHDIKYNDLEKMHYLKMVIKETLRFHTPVPLTSRVARNDVKLLGYDISAGTMVVINAWAIGMDPNYWNEPDRFDPNRFSNSSEKFTATEFEMIPFGAGRRGCPGSEFAMVIMELVLANIVHKFDWRLPENVQELDMTQLPGVAVHRAVPLLAIASDYCG